MNDSASRSDFEPRLPDDPAYWNALTERITAAAAPAMARLRARRFWWGPLERVAPLLSAGALAAAAVMVAVLPDRTPPLPTAPAAMTAAVDPTDLLENVFTTAPAPTVMTLMILSNEEQP